MIVFKSNFSGVAYETINDDLVPGDIKDLIPVSFHNSYQIKGRESVATGRDWSQSWCTGAGISVKFWLE